MTSDTAAVVQSLVGIAAGAMPAPNVLRVFAPPGDITICFGGEEGFTGLTVVANGSRFVLTPDDIAEALKEHRA